MLFRTGYCNSDTKSKKAWRNRRAGDAGWKISAAESMRVWIISCTPAESLRRYRRRFSKFAEILRGDSKMQKR
jgi:hypothetical protein